MIELLFYPTGRLPRLKFFLVGLAINIVTVILIMLLSSEEFRTTGQLNGMQIIILLLGMYPHVVLSIKRLHDLDRSGWWYLIFLIPFVNILFAIYLLFFKGTVGSNRFGNDPLSK